jgi:hypothetical protein
MDLPFTETEFLAVFARYNQALWPAAAGLWSWTAVTTLAGARHVRAPLSLRTLLVVHWLWSGAIYHLGFFTSINPAAWLFGALFLAQALMFATGARMRTKLELTRSRPRLATGAALVLYSLIYPLLVFASGMSYPAMPTFGLPCPTTLFTAGVLIAVDPPLPRRMFVIPVAWSLLAGTAALKLGVLPDYALFVAAAALVVRAWRGRRSTVTSRRGLVSADEGQRVPR